MPTLAQIRRDWSDKTPPFVLTAEQRARIAALAANAERFGCDPTGDIGIALRVMHQTHCYRHRPIVGLSHSLTHTGDIAFEADWSAHEAEHMSEAWAAYRGVETETALRAA